MRKSWHGHEVSFLAPAGKRVGKRRKKKKKTKQETRKPRTVFGKLAVGICAIGRGTSLHSRVTLDYERGN